MGVFTLRYFAFYFYRLTGMFPRSKLAHTDWWENGVKINDPRKMSADMRKEKHKIFRIRGKNL